MVACTSSCTINAVRSCDAGLRNDLLANIVCQGGHTRFRGFAERLQMEIEKLVVERGLGSELLRKPSRMMRAAGDAPEATSSHQHRTRHDGGGRPSSQVTVVAATQHSAWLGGSIISSTPGAWFEWIPKAHYDEEGPTVVHGRCCH